MVNDKWMTECLAELTGDQIRSDITYYSKIPDI